MIMAIDQLALFASLAYLGWDIWYHRCNIGEARRALGDEDGGSDDDSSNGSAAKAEIECQDLGKQKKLN